MVMIGYLALLFIGCVYFLDIDGLVLAFLLYTGVLTTILVFIIWKKGEKMKWHWGGKD